MQVSDYGDLRMGDNDTTWEAPPELLKFLKDGPAPVYVGFGSMSGGEAHEVTHTVVGALIGSKQRGIIVTGWGGLSKVEVPKTIYVAEHIPFDWLFPQVAAVVHHGGAGTLAEGLRAGKPPSYAHWRVINPFGEKLLQDWGRVRNLFLCTGSRKRIWPEQYKLLLKMKGCVTVQ